MGAYDSNDLNSWYSYASPIIGDLAKYNPVLGSWNSNLGYSELAKEYQAYADEAAKQGIPSAYVAQQLGRILDDQSGYSLNKIVHPGGEIYPNATASAAQWLDPKWWSTDAAKGAYNADKGLGDYVVAQQAAADGGDGLGGLGLLAGLALTAWNPLGWGAIASGALGGGVGGLLSTGDIEAGLKGAALGGAGGAIFGGAGSAASSTASTAGANNMGFWDYLSSGDWGGAWDAASNYFTGGGTSIGGEGTWLEGVSAADLAKAGYTPYEISSLSSMVGLGAPGTWLEGVSAADLANAGYTQSEIASLAAMSGGNLGSGMLGSIGKQVGSSLLSKGISGALGLGGSYLSGRTAQQAAQTSADAQVQAARIAADAAKFRPVGITTNFGSSQFGYDANGNLVSAGYTLTPEMKAQQAKLMGYAGQYLDQYGNVINATAPMGQAAQTMFNLGNSYLSTSPEEQAKKYYDEQMALVGASDERSLAALNAKLQAQGRGGLAMGGTSTGMMAANPDLEAYYNSQLQRNLQLAANATQGGMDYAKFGAGLVGSGGNMLNSMYTTQSNAYNPYQTALGGATTIEGLGQNALTQGMNMGSTVTAANANAGGLLATGMTNAAKTMQPANAYDPWGSLLSGAGTTIANMTTPQQQYTYDPYTGQKLTSGSTL